MSIRDPQDSIANLSFNHDGKKVVFDRCRNEGCQIQVYDLETGELAAYQSPENERWTMGKYSYDGKQIAFSVMPINSKGNLDLSGMQIAVMDADGKNYKKVTTGPGAKLYPSFSHNGKKILYACAAQIREEGRTPAAQYDAWEVNLETSQQTQLTFFKYYYMSSLAYYPDDERYGNHKFVHHAGSINYAAISPDGEYLGINHGDSIFVIRISDDKYYRAMFLRRFKDWDNKVLKMTYLRLLQEKPQRIINQ